VVNVVADGGALAQPFAMGFIGREYFRVKSVADHVAGVGSAEGVRGELHQGIEIDRNRAISQVSGLPLQSFLDSALPLAVASGGQNVQNAGSRIP
jgi:hypothetical protein